MSVAAFLAELRSRNMEVWADGEQLRCNAPAGALTAEVRERLRLHKYDILAFLRSAETLARQSPAIVPLHAQGSRPPIFAVPGHSGDVFCYRALVEHLNRDQPFYGLQPPGVDGRAEPLARIEDIAAYFVDQILDFYDTGPMVIAGYCAGGTIAFELARQLTERGRAVSFVALFAGPYPNWYRALPQLRERLRYVGMRARHHLRELATRPLADGRRYIQEHLRFRAARQEETRGAAANPLLIPRHKIEAITLAAVRAYEPRHFAGRLCLFVPNRRWLRSKMLATRWRRVARQVDEYCGEGGGGPGCEGDAMLLEPAAQSVANQLQVATGCCRHAT